MKTRSPFKRIPYQNIPQGASSSGYVDRLIGFLETVLPDFPKEKQLTKDQSENELTEELYKFLTRKARLSNLPFEFQTEKSQRMPKGHDKRMDMAARVNTIDIDMELIYCLEAKKLPTGSGARSNEYVAGEKGGIERFKNEAHGKDDSGNLLPRNGMIAYVIKHDFSHWHAQINDWISDASWPASEKLLKDYFSEIGKLISNHLRISGTFVELTHFWIKV